MQKLSRMIPRETPDKIGLFTTLLLLFLVTVNDLIILYYKSFESITYSILLFFIGIFILLNIFGNLYRAINEDTTINSIQLQIKQLPDWRYCSICEQYAPPRAYHCFTCKKCILKRHNHCLFLGKCAGYKNLRFYLLFIFYVWLGTLISNIINIDFYLNALNELSLKTLIITFAPWLAWIIGMVTLKQFFFIFTNAATFILFFLLFFYFLINFKMVLNGQTWYDNSKGNKIYSVRCMSNFIDSFGYNWLNAFLCAFSKLNLPSDGTIFQINNKAKFSNQKTI